MGGRRDNQAAWLELVPQRDLDPAWGVDHISAATASDAECTAGDVPIKLPKHVPIKGIRNVGFNRKELTLGDARSLGDREVFVHVTRTSKVAEHYRQCSKGIAALSHQSRRILVHEGSAIKEARIARICWCKQTRVCILRASTIE